MNPGDECGPALYDQDGTKSTTTTATDQSVRSADDGTAVPLAAGLLGDDGPVWPAERPWAEERQELLAAFRAAVDLHGSDAPRVASADWWSAKPGLQLVAALARAVVLHDRASRCEVSWTIDKRAEEAARLTAEREASHAVAAALDWAAASRHPSHAELVRRRSVIA